MSLSRKSFLEVAVTGGLGLLFGGSALAGNRWRDRGTSLVSVCRSSLVMGSVLHFQVVAERKEDAHEGIRRAVAVFRDLDDRLSMYDPKSEMGRLAAKSGEAPVPVSEEAMAVLAFAKRMWHRSGGRFDVTIEPAMKQWGFRNDPSERIEQPDERKMKELEQLIGSEKLILDGDRAYLDRRGMAVDLGGIAGGYALDRAVAVMKQCDLVAGFLNFSGDICCFGEPLNGSGWPVHILNPYTQQPLTDPVLLHDEALSTSGAYQNRREDHRNRSWGHLLLPVEARPYKSAGSVTAIHSSAMAADAWSTAAYVGADKIDEVRWIEL